MIYNKLGESYYINKRESYVIGSEISVSSPGHPFDGLCGRLVMIKDGEDSSIHRWKGTAPEAIVDLEPPVLKTDIKELVMFYETQYPEGSPWDIKGIPLKNISFSLSDIYSVENKSNETFRCYVLKEVYCVFADTYISTRTTFRTLSEAKRELNKRFQKAKSQEGYIHDWYQKGYEIKETSTDSKIHVEVVGDCIAQDSYYYLSLHESTLQLANEMIREIGWVHDSNTYEADFFSRADEYSDISEDAFYLMLEDKDNITSSVDKSLGNNDMYWECYWQTMDDVADLWLKDHEEQLKQLALEKAALEEANV